MSEAALGIGTAGSSAAARRVRATAEPAGLVLWIPPALGLGIGVYFLLVREPAAMLGFGVLALALALAVWLRRTAWRWVPMMLAAAALGFALAQTRTAQLATPMLERPAERVALVGTVERIEHLPEGVRVRLSNLSFERPERLRWSLASPPQIRIRLTKRSEIPPVGARIEILANLFPFSGPLAPGTYDFRRDAFFKGIGATGYAISRPRVLEQPPPSGWSSHIETLRQHIAVRVHERLDGDVAAIAQALLTGKQTAISEAALTPFRDSGLSHIYSISGLHIGLATGIVFFAVRFLLALMPPIALNFDVKRGAAIVALAAAWAYTALVGFPIPAQRSAVMASLALIAICFDRDPFSLRVIALAAIAVLLFTPEALLNPSFQLSFAAVLGLIAGWQALEPYLSLHAAGNAWWRRLVFSTVRTIVSSLIASAATLPFLVYHFHTAQFYAALANALALPLMGALIMPATVATYFALPFGLDAITLSLLGQGLKWLLWIAETVAALPGASMSVAPLARPFLVAVALLALFLCIGPKRWRALGWLAVPVLLLGLTVYKPPDLLVSAAGDAVAVRTGADEMVMLSGKPQSFLAKQWQGVMTAPGIVLPAKAATENLRCDALGCIIEAGERTIAVSFAREALAEDCARAAIVVAPSFRLSACAAPYVIDRAALRSGGAHAVWLRGAELRILTAAERSGARPWTEQGQAHAASPPQSSAQ